MNRVSINERIACWQRAYQAVLAEIQVTSLAGPVDFAANPLPRPTAEQITLAATVAATLAAGTALRSFKEPGADEGGPT